MSEFRVSVGAARTSFPTRSSCHHAGARSSTTAPTAPGLQLATSDAGSRWEYRRAAGAGLSRSGASPSPDRLPVLRRGERRRATASGHDVRVGPRSTMLAIVRATRSGAVGWASRRAAPCRSSGPAQALALTGKGLRPSRRRETTRGAWCCLTA
jgi:hypothetical protein